MSSLSMGIDVTAIARTTGAPSWTRTVDIGWSPADPLVVKWVFGNDNPEWVISRDLLWAGLGKHAGLHDVLVCPDPDNAEMVRIRLVTPSGQVTLLVDRVDLDAFLLCTFERCPAGHEIVAVPDDVASLLRECDGSGA